MPLIQKNTVQKSMYNVQGEFFKAVSHPQHICILDQVILRCGGHPEALWDA